jgi:hypothetical protein
MTESGALCIGMVLGAAIALGGVLLGARLVWRASGHEEPIVSTPAAPQTEQEVLA